MISAIALQFAPTTFPSISDAILTQTLLGYLFGGELKRKLLQLERTQLLQ